jgi:hypothetical protein
MRKVIAAPAAPPKGEVLECKLIAGDFDGRK